MQESTSINLFQLLVCMNDCNFDYKSTLFFCMF